jgi:O-antigen/teichoic acid export membrane protein
MPKIAALPTHAHMPLLRRALIAHGVVSGVLLVITVASYQWVVENVFGARYSVEPQVFISVAVGSVVVYTHSIISAVLVGKGHNRVEMLSRVAGLVASVAIGLLFVPTYGALGAGLCMLTGGIASLVALIVLRQPQNKGQKPQQEQPSEQPALSS